ncbi:OLC1v1024453C1 [Oldenlandia corymbosa var. corymbosa]|uniref:OLC1v1024453C1 n=1 Tax=Oldenlandia corymbosa var. corymbosa TaxID=529605 RepID=A0AAV1C457_OLDCO|nr:OLC1v1024453C1 [Oldenlandia corymbosa var. corymbosa]
MGMHATKERVGSDPSTIYSISLYESTITTRDEPWFGELKLALGLIGLSVIARDRIEVLPPVVGTTRARLGKNGEVHPNRPMKNKRRAKRQWRAKRMRNGHKEKEVWRRSSRAHSLHFLGPKQCSLSWPNQGLGASCYAT